MTPLYTALLVIFLSCSVLSEDLDAGERIYNGQPATRGLIPYIARCFQKTSGGAYTSCGGSLIAPSWVLTAGHCAINTVAVTIFLGMVDKNNQSGVLTYSINRTNIVMNPTYNTTNQQNDFALYRLPSPVPFQEYPYVSMISLPKRSQTYSLFDNYNGTISGWGGVNDTTGADILQYATAHVMPHLACEKYYAPSYPITDGMICVDKTVYNTGGCPGDSGGPLAVNDTDGKLRLIGSTSWGITCTGKYPVVYAFTGKILDWLSQTTGVQIEN